MSTTDSPNLPTHPGAIVGEWHSVTGHPDDRSRVLTWSRHDVAGVCVAVTGLQFADGQVDRHVWLCPDNGDVELDAAGARKLAALLDAADSLEGCQ